MDYFKYIFLLNKEGVWQYTPTMTVLNCVMIYFKYNSDFFNSFFIKLKKCVNTIKIVRYLFIRKSCRGVLLYAQNTKKWCFEPDYDTNKMKI